MGWPWHSPRILARVPQPGEHLLHECSFAVTVCDSLICWWLTHEGHIVGGNSLCCFYHVPDPATCFKRYLWPGGQEKATCQYQKKKKNAISAVAETFSSKVQYDTYEFLGYCLEQLKEDMEKLTTTLKTERKPGMEIHLRRCMWIMLPARHLFVPLWLTFEWQRSIICKACGQVVLKTEPSHYLSINLPQETKRQPSSIQNSFDLFFRAEDLEYSCNE